MVAGSIPAQGANPSPSNSDAYRNGLRSRPRAFMLPVSAPDPLAARYRPGRKLVMEMRQGVALTMTQALTSRRTAAQIWTMPIVLAALSALGLVSALLGDGVYDALSWMALGAPIAVAGWFAFRP